MNTTSTWDGDAHIVRTQLTGAVTVAHVTAWERGLQALVAQIPDGVTFRLLVDLVGFAPVDIAAHKAMRAVVPLLLAEHGMRPALLDLFEGEHSLAVTAPRGVRCTACANVHHDATKMKDYQKRLGRLDQAFFSELAAAETWLATAPH